MSSVISTWLGKHESRLVVVHGGAGRWKTASRRIEKALEALRQAASIGYHALLEKNPLEAIVESIRSMEDSGYLNAGVGSVLNYDGEIEMDAGLMTGDGRSAGVASVKYPKNPIILARMVIDLLDHVIIGGEPADKLAMRLGLEKHPGPTREALERWRSLKNNLPESGVRWALKIKMLYGDTVGSIAVKGLETAAGTSTGGIILKHPGRIGDSAIPGAGFYAENGVGACAATGIGETIILGRPCITAIDLIRQGFPVEDAARASVARHTKMYGENNLGVIIATVEGEAAAAINTEAMPIAIASSAGVKALLVGRSS